MLLAAVVLLIATPAAEASSQTAFTITGRGWGHGIGMSQWGAYGLARHGSTYKEILRHYYSGIGFMTLGNPTIRVRLRSGLSTVRLTCANAYTASRGGTVVTIPAGTTSTTTYANGKYRVTAGGRSWRFTGAVTFRPSKGQLNLRTATDLGQTGRHRGTIRVVASGGSLMMINRVPMESYLRSVVPHEVSPSWPREAVKAQACAARSYAERSRRNASGAWDLYCDVRSQAYGGVSWEDPRSDAAISKTTGIVPSYGGAPISAFYFSCSGGYTENIELAWATSAVPYLKAVKDPYDSYATLHTWGPLRKTPAQLASSLGSSVKGSLRAIYRVKRGKSPRIVRAAIIGSSGTTYLHGSSLRVKLGLNSTWATFKSMSISPAARDKRAIAKGASVTLKGRVYPALASGESIKLMANRDGTWRSSRVSTTRRSQTLAGGYVARYSTYTVTLSPGETTQYYFASSSAKSPKTMVTVKR
ncbi:MAG TPA: SpoIID/LytB domain-containing protein [Thermoleophilia bacterium]|nr:SpoIID/LytB domain-containing protein [Thermoleophilia bacterium]